MSYGHGKADIGSEIKLADFKKEISREVNGLLADGAQRWTKTSIAKAGGMSRNQLYAWMGTGPQRLKKLPPAERVIRFYQGVKRPWDRLFRILGWDPTPHAPPGGEEDSELDRGIRLLEARLSQNPPVEERRELELRLSRTRRARDAQRLADELMAEVRAESDPVE